MSIRDESYQTLQFNALATIDSLASTGDAAVIYDVLQPITVTRIGAVIGTAASTTAAVIEFDRRILTDSDTGRGTADVGTVTIPAATPAGKILYKDVQIDLNVGDQVVPQVVTTSEAGSARYFIEYIARHESAANQSDMIASA